jgi:5-hydroxyisourate hydrolase
VSNNREEKPKAEGKKTGRLTTHVLDVASGRPAAGVRIELLRTDGGAAKSLASVVTNSDGRCDRPLLEGEALTAGAYELRFHAGAYFKTVASSVRPFYDVIPIPFIVADEAEHYHVPLLLAPFGYSTYRGS